LSTDAITLVLPPDLCYLGGVNTTDQPNLVIVAGPNGSGKSTVAEFLLANRSIDHYINADVIAKGMAVSGREGSDISAGRVLLQLVDEILSRRRSLAFESTMSGGNWQSVIARAKKLGYEVTICFVAVDSPDRAVERVQQRVREGGHNIPEATVRRRYERSLSMFFTTYRHLVQFWYFFDNSGVAAQLVATREGMRDEQILLPKEWGGYERR
jgi:predicted ABC-type ATPase